MIKIRKTPGIEEIPLLFSTNASICLKFGGKLHFKKGINPKNSSRKSSPSWNSASTKIPPKKAKIPPQKGAKITKKPKIKKNKAKFPKKSQNSPPKAAPPSSLPCQGNPEPGFWGNLGFFPNSGANLRN